MSPLSSLYFGDCVLNSNACARLRRCHVAVLPVFLILNMSSCNLSFWSSLLVLKELTQCFVSCESLVRAPRHWNSLRFLTSFIKIEFTSWLCFHLSPTTKFPHRCWSMLRISYNSGFWVQDYNATLFIAFPYFLCKYIIRMKRVLPSGLSQRYCIFRMETVLPSGLSQRYCTIRKKTVSPSGLSHRYCIIRTKTMLLSGLSQRYWTIRMKTVLPSGLSQRYCIIRKKTVLPSGLSQRYCIIRKKTVLPSGLFQRY